MNVARVGMLNNVSRASFGHDQSQKAEQKAAPSYENPISRKKEKALATLSVIGGSAVLGAVVGGLVSCLKIGTKKSALIGVGTAVVTAALALPSKLYSSKRFCKRKRNGRLLKRQRAQISFDRRSSQRSFRS